MIIFSVHWTTLVDPLLFAKAWIRKNRIEIFSIKMLRCMALLANVQHLNSQPCIGFKKTEDAKIIIFHIHATSSLEKHARRLQTLFYWKKTHTNPPARGPHGAGLLWMGRRPKECWCHRAGEQISPTFTVFIGTFMPSCMGIVLIIRIHITQPGWKLVAHWFSMFPSSLWLQGWWCQQQQLPSTFFGRQQLLGGVVKLKKGSTCGGCVHKS